MSPYRTTEPIDFPRVVPDVINLHGWRSVRASYVHSAIIGGGDGDVGESCLVMQDGSKFAVSHDEARYVAALLGLST